MSGNPPTEVSSSFRKIQNWLTAVNQSQSLFFIALLPPLYIQDYANQIKQIFANQYGSHAALKSPPHITLQPPFRFSPEEVPVIEQCLSEFALQHQPVPVILEGFAAFPPRVIFINVLKTEELLALQAELMFYLETKLGIVDPVSKTRPYAPHLTVAFKDLTRKNFKAAWSEFQQQQLHFYFTATMLTLLRHDGKQWNISAEFALAIKSEGLNL